MQQYETGPCRSTRDVGWGECNEPQRKGNKPCWDSRCLSQPTRAFVRLRETLSTNQEVMHKLDQLERKIETHDQAIVGILAALRE